MKSRREMFFCFSDDTFSDIKLDVDMSAEADGVRLQQEREQHNSGATVNVGIKKILLYSSHLGPSVEDYVSK